MHILLLDIIVLSISGLLGQKALENTGGIMFVITLGAMVSTNGFTLGTIGWGVAYWALALLIGYVVVVVKDVVAEKH